MDRFKGDGRRMEQRGRRKKRKVGVEGVGRSGRKLGGAERQGSMEKRMRGKQGQI